MSREWTEKEIKILKTMWADGASASQIARCLPADRTRNAVLGRVLRMGLTGRTNTPPRSREIARPPQRLTIAVLPKLPAAPVVEEDPVVLEDGGHVTVMTINDRMCHWPIGDPIAAEFHFCGRSPKSGYPYCEAHARKAYQPAKVPAA